MIEKVSYKINDNSYIKDKSEKKQIVIGNTHSSDMSHVKLWSRKINGNFKGTTPYTIKFDGTIHEHFNPEYYSDFINIKKYDKKIIPILIENEGWLVKNGDNELINWCGDIYNRGTNNVIETKWRNKSYWAPYNNIQLDSLASLCTLLSEKFDIPLIISDHNTKIDDIGEKLGIYYKSNYNKKYLDVSPAFNIRKFKNKI